ncbi:thioesterase family protein [Solicola gregarius]|uniref:Thioesterase family protein n=1 Tax=Solicola gregarius TaxID=2908642 RepID=A0AA46TG18_9ACTN|nr:thioesterase family protein [Solicola gregarius]UYM04518.1 thioesterase family protein [Solicola gregarius]
MSEHPFDVDTTAEPVEPGLFRAEVTDRWTTANKTPNGGYLTALLLRTLGATMPQSDPLTCSVSFLKPGAPGEAQIRTSTLRAGRSVATGQATLEQNGVPIAHLVGSFVDRDRAAGRSETFVEPPSLPPVEECFDPDASSVFAGMSILQRSEYRLASPPGWALGKPSGAPSGEFWMRLEGGRAIDPYALSFMVDGYAPAVLEIGELNPATVQLTVYIHATPAPGWLACRHSTRFVRDGYHDENFELWDEAGTLVAESHQLALLL